MAGTVKLASTLNRVRERLNKDGSLTLQGGGPREQKVVQTETKEEKKARLLQELKELE